jgi:hypothetical protein
MRRRVEAILAVVLLAASAGCCAGPYRFFQNAYGWNNPDIERYCPGPPPPVTTPPGYSSPVVPEEVIASTGRTSPGVQVPADAAPPTEVLPEQVPVPEDGPSDGDPLDERPSDANPADETPSDTTPNEATPSSPAPTSLRPQMVVPASYNGPTRLPPVEDGELEVDDEPQGVQVDLREDEEPAAIAEDEE